MSRAQELGKWGEQYVVDALLAQGYEILDRNWHCRSGELDIVAAKGDTLAIVEVKTRTSSRYDQPRDAVTPSKQKKLLLAAQCWLMAHPEVDLYVRMDVAEVFPATEEHPAMMNYLENAIYES